ncbi:SCO1860 family LAETG-anchored protein [Kitasatospora azatica]|uniref:SCO1860 family LAETG-anchored protein n=1 Tax=Kitasatospora azatica TaxID=58347 RepID=UPI00055E1FC5|nr:SCO1860 family LAETG-anchored protein [Kitasatospora azatica]
MSSRTAALLAATALAALPVALPVTPAAAAPAGSTGNTGSASAVTAELDLHVSLLNNAVDVPVELSLNKVHSPAELHGSMLTATVAGVAQPDPVTLVKADIGRSDTHVDAQGAKASVTLANADVHAPGLPLTALLGLEALSSEADCPVDGPPTAKVTSPARLTVLGKPVTLSVYGPTHVAVPGIGSVDMEFSQRTTTSTTAAASALVVKVAVNPLNLNVAKVDGTITVASVSCEKPTGGPSGAATPSAAPSGAPAQGSAQPSTAAQVADASAVATSSGAPSVTPTKHAVPGAELASTGSSGTLPVAAAGAALLVAGGVAVTLGRRRRRD